MRIIKCLLFVILPLIILLLNIDNCFADVSTFDKIAENFQEVSNNYTAKLIDYALALFKLFLLIDIALFGVKAVLNRSDIGDIIFQFCITMIFASFCFLAIKYYQDWTEFLLNKSQSIATAVGGGKVTFSPLETGLDILDKVILAAPSGYTPAGATQALGYLILGGVIMICFALMAARMLVILCESYIAMSAAVILLGFGGSSMTKDYAINTMRYAVSVAFKLFTIRLLLGVGLAFINGLGVFNKIDIPGMFMILASAVVLLVLINTLPETVAGIINGSHVGGGVGLKAAASTIYSAGAAAATVGAKTVGGVANAAATVSRAAKIANLQGHGGFGGAGSQLWKSYQEARQDEKRAGTGPSAIGKMRRMDASIKDMYTATRAANDPNYSGNEYSRNRFSGNPYGPNASSQQSQQSQQSNQSAQASAPFGSTAGQAQAAADARSAGPHGAAPGNTPGADRDKDGSQSGTNNPTAKAALKQQKENSRADGGR